MRINRAQLRQMINEELARRVNLRESVGDIVIDTFMSMDIKPVGVIVDNSFGESSVGGPYPAYWSDGKTITKFSEDVGSVVDALTGMISEVGVTPEGFWLAGYYEDEDGNSNFDIYNSI